jgi:hypothetical protein
MFLNHVRRNNMSEYCDRKDYECKTSGSILHGLVIRTRMHSAITFSISMIRRKIPADVLGTLRKY